MNRKVSNNEYEKTYNHYNDLCSKIPDVLREKIKNTSNNKGYIWRGLYLYGEKPVQKESDYEVTTMFEKIERDTTLIHIWDVDNYKVYRKEQDKPKFLIKDEKRKKYNNKNR